MDTNLSITKSFEQSISSKTLDLSVDTAEVVLDSFMDDGILKEIPIVKYAVSAYKIVDDLKDRYFIRKLRDFIVSFNSNLLLFVLHYKGFAKLSPFYKSFELFIAIISGFRIFVTNILHNFCVFNLCLC